GHAIAERADVVAEVQRSGGPVSSEDRASHGSAPSRLVPDQVSEPPRAARKHEEPPRSRRLCGSTRVIVVSRLCRRPPPAPSGATPHGRMIAMARAAVNLSRDHHLPRRGESARGHEEWHVEPPWAQV